MLRSPEYRHPSPPQRPVSVSGPLPSSSSDPFAASSSRVPRRLSHQPYLATYPSQASVSTTVTAPGEPTSPVVVDYTPTHQHELSQIGAGRFWTPEDGRRPGFLKRKIFRKSTGSGSPLEQTSSGALSVQPPVIEPEMHPLAEEWHASTPPPPAYHSQVNLISPVSSNEFETRSHPVERQASITSSIRSSVHGNALSRTASINTLASAKAAFPALNADEKRRSLAQQISRDERQKKTLEQLKRLQDVEDKRLAEFENLDRHDRDAPIPSDREALDAPSPRPPSQISSISSNTSSLPEALKLNIAPQSEGWRMSRTFLTPSPPHSVHQPEDSTSSHSPVIAELAERTKSVKIADTTKSSPTGPLSAKTDKSTASGATTATLPPDELPKRSDQPAPTVSLSPPRPQSKHLSSPPSFVPTPVSSPSPALAPSSMFADLNLLRANFPRRHSRSASSPSDYSFAPSVGSSLGAGPSTSSFQLSPFPTPPITSPPPPDTDAESAFDPPSTIFVPPSTTIGPPSDTSGPSSSFGAVELSTSNSVLYNPQAKKLLVHQLHRRYAANQNREAYNTLPHEPYPLLPREELVEAPSKTPEGEQNDPFGDKHASTSTGSGLGLEPDIDPRTNMPWDPWSKVNVSGNTPGSNGRWGGL